MLLGTMDELPEDHTALLGAMTKKIVKMGSAGAGYVSKLCQLHLNYLVAQALRCAKP